MAGKKNESYFQKHSASFNLEQFSRSNAVRESQKGAVFAVLAHSIVENIPGIVAMPTGTGKTAVMMLAPFLLKAKRVLIVTSSRLVRGQIAEDFGRLETLSKLKVFESDIAAPNVVEITERLTARQWNDYKKADVLVALPPSISPHIKEVIASSQDYFDLVLFDEAHHAPSESWHALMRHYDEARQFLFTATPFRRDVLSLPGKLIYSYPVIKAFEEKTLRTIHFEAVEPEEEQDVDCAIAIRAEAIFIRDRKLGLNHKIVVRTDNQKRAEELFEIYTKNTNLNLELVHSGLNYGNVKASITKLKNNSVDGIVCVDMLGEGFDFPQLKIAAVHSPHKSLAVTLQFIGRFGRVNATDIGDATFVAQPNAVILEGRKLYEEGVIWQEVVPQLADIALHREAFSRDTFAKFQRIGRLRRRLDPAIIRTFDPFCHAKVYQVPVSPNFREPIDFGSHKEILIQELSGDERTLVIVTRKDFYPTWSRATELQGSEWHLVILHYDSEHGFLFINSSRRSASIYLMLVNLFCKNGAYPVSGAVIHRVLRGLEDFDIFNLGMRGRNKGTNTEAYKTTAGSNVDKAITPSDLNRFVQGHVVLSAKDNERGVTIGYSSAGKTWRNEYLRVPEYINWCTAIAKKLGESSDLVTGTTLDKIVAGETITVIEFLVIGARWDYTLFKNPPIVQYVSSDGVVRKSSLDSTTFVVVNSDASVKSKIDLHLEIDDYKFPFSFELSSLGGFCFAATSAESQAIVIIAGTDELSMEDYLNQNPLVFYTFDFGVLVGSNYVKCSTPANQSLEEHQFRIVDWKSAGVNIQSEKSDTANGISIFRYMETALGQCHDVVYADDGSGEVADYIGFKSNGADLRITLYHCKASAKAKPGSRLEDIYEVSGQSIKSFGVTSMATLVVDRILDRFNRKKGKATFVTGSIADLESIKKTMTSYQLFYSVVIVQPGISKKEYASSNVGQNLVGTAGLLQSYGVEFQLWGSE